MSKKSRVLCGVLMILVAFGLIASAIQSVKAADSWTARTLIIPFNGESFKVIVLRQKSTGNLITAASGVVSSAVTWDNAEITGVAH